MNEQEILNKCKWVYGFKNLYGYLSLKDANVLVNTGKYRFFNVHCWGYIVEKI